MLRARHVGVGVPRDVLAQRSRRVSTRGFCSGNPTFPTRRATGSRAARPSRSRDAPMDARPIAVGFPHASSPSLNAPHAPRVRRARLSVAPCRSSVRLIADVSSSLSPPQPPKAPESKAAKAATAMAGGKGKKKKWSKGKNKEKANNQVLFEQSTYDKLMAEVPKYKMISVSILTDRLRITCSLARKAIAVLIAQGHIKPVTMHSKQQIYTRTTADE